MESFWNPQATASQVDPSQRPGPEWAQIAPDLCGQHLPGIDQTAAQNGGSARVSQQQH